MQTSPSIAILGFLGVSAILLDGAGLIMDSNEEARRTLGLGETDEGPPQRVPEPLRKYLSPETLAAVVDEVVCIYLPRPERRALALMLVAAWPGDAKSVLVALIDLEDLCLPKRTVLRRAFGLSDAEADVAREIAVGQTVGDIAKTLGLSASTVRAHLRVHPGSFSFLTELSDHHSY